MKFPKIEVPRFERKIKEADPPGVTVPEWLVKATKFAAWVATFALIYFLWLYTLDVARDRAEPLHLTHLGNWTGEMFFWFPHIIGFAVVAFGIPYVAKIAIPTFVSLSWRQDPTAKVWSLLIAVAVSLVVISGTFAVQGHTIMERDRDAAVAVEQVQQGRSVIEAQIESKRQELADMMNNRNAYLAQAASVGAAEWQRSYIDATPANDPQRDRIVRALGAARAADTVRGEIEALRAQLAQAPAVASVQREVVTESTGWIASTLGWLEGVRAILLSFVMDIVALIMPLIALRLEQARNRQLGLVNSPETSGWAPAGLRIEDMRNEAPIERNPYIRDTGTFTRDANGKDEIMLDEDGAPLKEVRYWKREDGKPLVKNRAQPVSVQPNIPPSERGVRIDGGNRIAVGADGLGGVMESVDPSVGIEPEAPAAEIEAGVPEQADVGDREQEQEPQQINLNDHPEPSLEMSEEDVILAYGEASAAVDAVDGVSDAGETDADHRDEEPPGQIEEFAPTHNAPRKPEQNPARLIAPVAAE